MSQNHNDIYSILGKLESLTPKAPETKEAQPQKVYESVDAKGSILEGVTATEQRLSEKYMGFKKTVAAIKKGGSAENPEAVAAAIGREKYGKKAFQKAAAAGKKMGEGELDANQPRQKWSMDPKPEDMPRGERQRPQYFEDETCNECGMPMEGCGCDHLDEREFHSKDEFDAHAKKGDTYKSDKHTVTKTEKGAHYKAHPPKDEFDSDEEDDDKQDGGPKRGRPRKDITVNPRRDPNKPKGARGRPKKEKSDGHSYKAHDPFGRVHSDAHELAKKHWPKDKKHKHVDEKAVSVAQQRFMGMVHAAQKGEKPASADVAKVAKSMGKKDARDFAATKHKGLPQHVSESVNFKRMMEEQHMTLDEMLECMNADMKMFKETGVCSDRLRGMMEVYAHAKKEMEEAQLNPVPSKGTDLVTPQQRVAGATPPKPGIMGKVKDTLGGFKDWITGKPEDPTRPTFEEPTLESELNELARLAGLSTEGNAFTGKLKSTPKGGKFELDGKEYTDTSSLDEEPNEGNAFTGKLAATKKGDKFDLDGKEYTDTSDLDEEKLTVKDAPDAANKPKPKYGTIKAITKQGDDLNRPKRQDPGTANKAANPFANDEKLTLEDRLSAEYESIKKVSK